MGSGEIGIGGGAAERRAAELGARVGRGTRGTGNVRRGRGRRLEIEGRGLDGAVARCPYGGGPEKCCEIDRGGSLETRDAWYDG